MKRRGPAPLSKRPHSSFVLEMFSELPGITNVDLTTVNQCITTLTRVLATRVTERDHPEGWFFSKEDGE